MFLMHSILSIMYPQHKYDTATILIFNDLIIILTQFQYVSDLGSKHMYIVRQLNNYHAYFTTKMGEMYVFKAVFSVTIQNTLFLPLLNCVHQLIFLTFAKTLTLVSLTTSNGIMLSTSFFSRWAMKGRCLNLES